MSRNNSSLLILLFFIIFYCKTKNIYSFSAVTAMKIISNVTICLHKSFIIHQNSCVFTIFTPLKTFQTSRRQLHWTKARPGKSYHENQHKARPHSRRKMPTGRERWKRRRHGLFKMQNGKRKIVSIFITLALNARFSSHSGAKLRTPKRKRIKSQYSMSQAHECWHSLFLLAGKFKAPVRRAVGGFAALGRPDNAVGAVSSCVSWPVAIATDPTRPQPGPARHGQLPLLVSQSGSRTTQMQTMAPTLSGFWPCPVSTPWRAHTHIKSA